MCSGPCSASEAKGSHHIFVHPDVAELVNLQKVQGQAKPYQVRRFLRLVERHNLKLEDGGYIADIPDLEACSAVGEDPATALQEVERAKALWLEAAEAEGRPIPKPRYRPLIYQVGSV